MVILFFFSPPSFLNFYSLCPLSPSSLLPLTLFSSLSFCISLTVCFPLSILSPFHAIFFFFLTREKRQQHSTVDLKPRLPFCTTQQVLSWTQSAKNRLWTCSIESPFMLKSAYFSSSLVITIHYYLSIMI